MCYHLCNTRFFVRVIESVHFSIAVHQLLPLLPLHAFVSLIRFISFHSSLICSFFICFLSSHFHFILYSLSSPIPPFFCFHLVCSSCSLFLIDLISSCYWLILVLLIIVFHLYMIFHYQKMIWI